MRPEVQEFLDGERALRELPASLRPEARRWAELLEELRASAPEGAPPGLEERVMRHLDPARSPAAETPPATASGETARADDGARAWIRAWRWLTGPRTVRVSPLAGGLAAAALAALLLYLPPPAGERGGTGTTETAAAGSPTPGTSATVYVQFTLEAPEASSVAVAGDFTGWESRFFLEDVDGDGVWSGRVPVSPGVHEYMFVVDGERWVTDPRAERYSDDGFGNRNAVLAVATPKKL